MPGLKQHPISYGDRHSRGRGYGRDAESLVGSRYKGPGSTDNDMGSKFDESSWTPYTLIEMASILARLAWVFMSLWQLCRHSVFADGIWVGLLAGQMSASGLIMLVTGWAVYQNYQERARNVVIGSDGRPQKDADGQFAWKDKDLVHNLPEIRQGFFWTLAVAGADTTIFYFAYEFWHANIATPLDCVDQRRLDRNMWLILLVQTFASVEAIQYFFNFCVYMTRKAAGPRAQLWMDL